MICSSMLSGDNKIWRKIQIYYFMGFPTIRHRFIDVNISCPLVVFFQFIVQFQKKEQNSVILV